MAPPPDLKTRPMLDRVREALFSILGARVEEATVLDLFAGTGSLGLAALSRGAARVRFLEKGRKPGKLLEKNLEEFGLMDRGRVVGKDALDSRSWGREENDLVFLDPPYSFLRDGKRRWEVLAGVRKLAAEHLAPEGVIVLHGPKGALQVQDFRDASVTARERVYGTTSLWFLERAGKAEDQEENA